MRTSTLWIAGGSVLAIALALVVTTIVATTPGRALAGSASDDSAAVLEANAAFYTALNEMFTGDVAGIEAIWSHAEDVTYMGPTGGFQRGWTAVLADWNAQAAMMLGGEVQSADVYAIVGHDLAVVNNYELGENTNADGHTESVRLRATNVFRKENGMWKMIGHHTDTLPYLTQ